MNADQAVDEVIGEMTGKVKEKEEENWDDLRDPPSRVLYTMAVGPRQTMQTAGPTDDGVQIMNNNDFDIKVTVERA